MPSPFPHSPLSIGPIAIQPALVLAPLHEITDLPFRRMVRGLGGLGLTVTEMVSSEAITRNAAKAWQQMTLDGHPCAVQFSGADPERLAQAAVLAQEAGADLVDLNMGCPASNITSSGGGSALMRDIRRAEACVAAMAKVLKVPFTVKMRSGWDAAQKERGDFLEFMRMFRDYGIQALCLHPRTRTQQYTGHADWSIIARAVDAGMPYPIIGNGDVVQPEDAHRMVRETGCAGVMIGRAAMYNPYIFNQVLDPGLQVTPQMKITLTARYLRTLLAELPPREALHKIKKIGGWFTKGLSGGAAFRQQLNDSHDPARLLDELEGVLGTREGVLGTREGGVPEDEAADC